MLLKPHLDPSHVGGSNNHHQRPPWSVPRVPPVPPRLDGEELGGGNFPVSGNVVGRPANHEDSLSDALEGPAADEWSFREPNHSNSVRKYMR